MRLSKQQSAANRARFLGEAARLFRERGLGGVGVDALAGAAGLSHGSLYSQFGSKEQLAAEALAAALAESAARHDPALAGLLNRYLSPSHRDAPGGGCALAAVACEVPRQGAAVRAAYTKGVRGMIAGVEARLPEGSVARLPGGASAPRDDAALATVAAMVGALILARAVDDPALSDRILEATRADLTARHAGAAGDVA